jgi:hypothetical protein
MRRGLGKVSVYPNPHQVATNASRQMGRIATSQRANRAKERCTLEFGRTASTL